MFHPQTYLPALIAQLRRNFGPRLRYVGLQGSYLRGEATEDSDLDVMVVLDLLAPADLDRYRAILAALPQPEKACGFLCGRAELLRVPVHQNPAQLRALAAQNRFGCVIAYHSSAFSLLRGAQLQD